MMRGWLILLGILLPLHVQAAGLQWPVIADDPGSEPLQVAIWYPSHDPTTSVTLMNHRMNVAVDGAIADAERHHPLIIFSHGVTGGPFDHNDTAIALADAGFVVAAVMHTHDNSIEHTGSFTATNIADRPRHLSRTIDMMLNTWEHKSVIDPGHIGVFGFSAGGGTALLAIGGQANLGQIAKYCQKRSYDVICNEHMQRAETENDNIVITGVDPRIKAAVLAAPALETAFIPSGLSHVKVPIQLWIGGQDAWIPGFDYARTGLLQTPEYHFVPDASHLSFVAPCTPLAVFFGWFFHHGGCKEVNDFDRAAFHQTFNASVKKFFYDHLGSQALTLANH